MVHTPAPLSYGPSVIKDLAAAASNDWLTAGAQPPSQYLAEKAFLDHKKRPATSKQIWDIIWYTKLGLKTWWYVVY